MLDIKFIRENTRLVKENIKKKFQEDKLKLVDELLKKDEEYRKLLFSSQKFRQRRNSLSADIAKAKKEGKDIKKIIKEAKALPSKIAKAQARIDQLQEEIVQIQMIIPNIIHDSVKVGKDNSENVDVKHIGKQKKFKFAPKNHVEILEGLVMADFDASARTSGSGFYYLSGPVAQLNQALIRFAVDFMVKKGYNYTETPLMVNKGVVDGVMSFEEKDVMMYKIEGEDLYMIGTSEHSLIGMFINQTIPEAKLPIKLASYSMCFRKEIGSHGINEKGIFRTHQFNKVEQVILCKPEESYKLYDELLNNSIELFKALDIPTRVLDLCSADLADLKAKSADLEAWSPVKNDYFEVCSCSNLTDAQARRLNIRYGTKGAPNNAFVHTLNDTAIATSRALVAILENNQNEDGSVNVPKVLQPYMGGIKVIKKENKEIPKKKKQ